MGTIWDEIADVRRELRRSVRQLRDDLTPPAVFIDGVDCSPDNLKRWIEACQEQRNRADFLQDRVNVLLDELTKAVAFKKGQMS